MCQQNLAHAFQLKHHAKWETFARALTRKSLNMIFQTVLQPLVAPDADCGSQRSCGRELLNFYCLSFPHHKNPQVPAVTIFLKREDYKMCTSYFFMWELLEQIQGYCVTIETESYCTRSALVGGTGIWTTIILLYEHFMFPSNMHWW